MAAFHVTTFIHVIHLVYGVYPFNPVVVHTHLINFKTFVFVQ